MQLSSCRHTIQKLLCRFLPTAGLNGSESSIIVRKNNQKFHYKTTETDILWWLSYFVLLQIGLCSGQWCQTQSKSTTEEPKWFNDQNKVRTSTRPKCCGGVLELDRKKSKQASITGSNLEEEKKNPANVGLQAAESESAFYFSHIHFLNKQWCRITCSSVNMFTQC